MPPYSVTYASLNRGGFCCFGVMARVDGVWLGLQLGVSTASILNSNEIVIFSLF